MLTPATATIMGPAGCRCLWLLLFVCSEAVVIGEEEATVVAALLWLARWAATGESHPVAEAASACGGAGSCVATTIHWALTVWTPIVGLKKIRF